MRDFSVLILQVSHQLCLAIMSKLCLVLWYARNLESEPVPLRPMTEGLHSSTSSSEHPPTHLKKFQRVLSEGRMIPR
jgi:hypothetical protein